MVKEDLMIGDWVKFPIGNEKVVDLPYIEGKGVCASFAASATLFPVEMDKLEPIPLIAEILEKNGFGYIEIDDIMNITHFYLGDKHLCKSMDLHIGSNNKGNFWLNYLANSICGIHFVHELQHALRLCGIDKEIVV